MISLAAGLTRSSCLPGLWGSWERVFGRIKGVQLVIAEDAVDVDHLVSPKETVRVAMAPQ